ncbi:hypothetical protein ZWY2020_001993 [Hordeum vulgare]|nr:hypothetical protein ZWY2020_001993 [Hordeum vulgare]
MWHYSGTEDSTRTNVLSVTEEKVASWVLQITGACENPRGSRRVRAFSADNSPPNQKWTNWFSPVSNGNPAEEEEEGSQEGSVESAEYVSDSEESEEETSEEEEEDEEQDSPPPQLEHRTKRQHEPAVPSVPPASSSAPSPWAVRVLEHQEGWMLLRSRVDLPRVATSATSPARQEDDPMDTDNVVSSQPGAICMDDGDQGRAEQAAEPVLEAARFVLALANKTCEMGTAYETLRAEKIRFAGERDAALLAMDGMKVVLAEREKSLEEAREANKVLTEEVEKMGKQRTALMGQMDVLNKRCRVQEKYVSDWAQQMMTRLADFCIDAEAEAADVERSIRENVPLDEDANRDLLRAHIRVGKVGPFNGRLKEVVGRIDKELWPEDESRREMENLLSRLEEEVREEKLKTLKVANTKKLQFEDFMETFLESATRIADGINLDTFVEPSSPGADPDDA